MTRKVNTPHDPALAARMFSAQAQAETAQGRRLSLEEIGATVASLTRRADPVAPSVVRRWLRGLAEPNRTTFLALAAVFGVDPGWLAFGEEAALPADADDPKVIRTQATPRVPGQPDVTADEFTAKLRRRPPVPRGGAKRVEGE